ncbi:MAG: hypothetical protein Q8N05_12760 [Bacteroidota bacterium]|nr:hypothetical protein [Bacteroidota bacterium]
MKKNLAEFVDYNFEIYGLAYDCPVQNRKQDCPFTEIDQLKFKEKVDWIEGLNNGEKELIINHHSICSWNREQKKKQAGSM